MQMMRALNPSRQCKQHVAKKAFSRADRHYPSSERGGCAGRPAAIAALSRSRDLQLLSRALLTTHRAQEERFWSLPQACEGDVASVLALTPKKLRLREESQVLSAGPQAPCSCSCSRHWPTIALLSFILVIPSRGFLCPIPRVCNEVKLMARFYRFHHLSCK